MIILKIKLGISIKFLIFEILLIGDNPQKSNLNHLNFIIMGNSKKSNQEIKKDEKIESKIDFQNQESSSKESSKGDSKKEFKSSLYSWNPSKSDRSRLRRNRDSFINRIMDLNQKKEIEKRNDLLKEFNEFYKKEYLLNDYSLESLGFKNMKDDKKESIEDFLSHYRRWKIDLK